MTNSDSSNSSDGTVVCDHLDFTYNAQNALTLTDINFELPQGSRTLLLGGNGSGKSTLLRVLSGRHMASGGKVSICGKDSYRATELNFWRSYLSCDWGMSSAAFGQSSPMTASIRVKNMMEKLQNAHPERRDHIIDLLNIDPNWMMNELSDGQRRRVQLLLQLVRPSKVVLLDEVTTSLDLCVRMDLLDWLKTENTTVIYATHIFDHLDGWGTHCLFLTDKGTVGHFGSVDSLLTRYNEETGQTMDIDTSTSFGSDKLLALADRWLRRELVERRANKILEKAAGGGDLEDPKNRQGGYAPGRLGGVDVTQPARQGRLSDVLGNKGKTLAHA